MRAAVLCERDLLLATACLAAVRGAPPAHSPTLALAAADGDGGGDGDSDELVSYRLTSGPAGPTGAAGDVVAIVGQAHVAGMLREWSARGGRVAGEATC